MQEMSKRREKSPNRSRPMVQQPGSLTRHFLIAESQPNSTRNLAAVNFLKSSRGCKRYFRRRRQYQANKTNTPTVRNGSSTPADRNVIAGSRRLEWLACSGRSDGKSVMGH